MNLTLTDEQRELQSTLRRLMSEHCPTTLVRQLRDGYDGEEFEALWKALHASGALTVVLPEVVGGGGGTLIDVGLVMEAAGRALAPPVLKGTILFGLAIHHLGGDALRRRWLPRVCEQGLKATVVLPRSGTTPPVVAKAHPGGWALSGSLDFVIVPQSCEAVALVASTDAGDVLLAVADCRRAGFTRTPHQSLGTKELCRVTFDGHVVTAEDTTVIASGGDLDTPEQAWLRDAADALESVEAVGGAAEVLDRTVDYVSQRVQFGRPIGSFQAAQHHVANQSIAIDGARLLAFEALWALGTNRTDELGASIARAVAAATFKTTTLRGHQLHGGMGMTTEFDLHLWSERAKLIELLGESWDDLLDRVGTALAGPQP